MTATRAILSRSRRPRPTAKLVFAISAGVTGGLLFSLAAAALLNPTAIPAILIALAVSIAVAGVSFLTIDCPHSGRAR